MPQTRDTPHPNGKPSDSTHTHHGWRLEDAKARFSEVVRRARSEGPQHVSVRGRDAVVVIAADEFERLQPRAVSPLPFVAFMESLSGDGLDLARDPDTGRDVEL